MPDSGGASAPARSTEAVIDVAAPPLRRNISWAASGQLVNGLCLWGMLVVLTRLVSPEVVGRYALGMAVTEPIIFFAYLGLQSMLATDAKHQFEFGEYFALRISTTALALAVIAIVVVAVRYQWETAIVILAVGLAKAVDSISVFFYGLFQKNERLDRVALSMMFKGVLSLLTMSVVVYFTRSALWGVLAIAAARATTFLSFDLRNGARIALSAAADQPARAGDERSSAHTPPLAVRVATVRPLWVPARLKKLAQLALPLGYVALLMSITTNLPRYFIERFLGEGELGIFAPMVYMMVAGTMLIHAIAQSANPRLSRYYAAKDLLGFRRLLLKLLGLTLLLGCAGLVMVLLAGKEILIFLYGEAYAGRLDVFLWLMIAATVRYVATLLSYIMVAIRYVRAQARLMTLVAAIAVLASLWLVPVYGLQGAAMAMLIVAIVRVGGSIAIVLHALRQPV